MTVYVDPLLQHGWKLRGRGTASCHMFSSRLDLRELHRAADAVLLRRHWFQGHAATPHYDLVPSRREMVLFLGHAQELTRREAVEIWKARRSARKTFLALWQDRRAIGLPPLLQALEWTSGTEREILEVVLQLKGEKE